jgi:predicted nucleic acid-binding protein
MITQGGLRIAFELQSEIESVGKLMDRYRSLPMSLADACLVRMTELRNDSRLLTADSDFTVYRRNGRRLIPVLMPEIK